MADAAYGLWPLVVLNTLLFIAFAAGFFHPTTKRDWQAMGAYRVGHLRRPPSGPDARAEPRSGTSPVTGRAGHEQAI
ncbi:hypothetical protein ABZ835_46615 [Streptomyces sp. NPDC047461]|uniref:hypothetical protein n=1 Tax=Streptomyces sp. NPDC047461 TaxID=3155619 RepID=UPI0033F22656